MIGVYAKKVQCDVCSHYWFKKCTEPDSEHYNISRKPEDVCVKFELVDFDTTKILNKLNK